jgi:hypothetical protein
MKITFRRWRPDSFKLGAFSGESIGRVCGFWLVGIGSSIGRRETRESGEGEGPLKSFGVAPLTLEDNVDGPKNHTKLN